MSNYDFPPDLDALVQKQLRTGDYASADDVLLAALHSLESANEDWLAVKESLDTLDAGNRGVSAEEAFDEVRRRNGISS